MPDLRFETRNSPGLVFLTPRHALSPQANFVPERIRTNRGRLARNRALNRRKLLIPFLLFAVALFFPFSAYITEPNYLNLNGFAWLRFKSLA